jgi:3-deoxy-7-phosphoheptulonate synthase
MSGEHRIRSEEPSEPHPLVARNGRAETTRVRVGEVAIGGEEFIVAAGPCAVETEEQVRSAARAVAQAGARLLRGGAFKPRTSPYSFQGLGQEGLRLLAAAGSENGLPVVTEVLTAEDVPLVARYADMLQVGARNMQNFALLKALGAAGRPVLLKRGLSATIEEFLLAAEYVVSHGNPDVVLCERGIRTFETATRNTLDLNAVAWLKSTTHLPVIVDPSHGTGRRHLVRPLSKASLAAGADGLIVEVHPSPALSLSDGAQSLTPEDFWFLMRELSRCVPFEGRTLACPRPEPAGPRTKMSLYRLRERIDQLDEALVRLLNERARLASVIGNTKRGSGMPIHSPSREDAVLDRVRRLAAGPLSPDGVEKVFRAVIAETRLAEENGG